MKGYTNYRLLEGPTIDGLPGRIGDIVFWYDGVPRWIVEWQPDNGAVFAIVDAAGNVGLAGPDELTRDFRNRRRPQE